MEIEKEVPSIGLCRRWKALGGRQNTLFSWFNCDIDEWIIVRTDEYFGHDMISAPLASEMMEWEQEFDIRKRNFVYDIQTTHWFKIEFDNVPNALMQMCIARKEEEGGCHKK